MNKYEKLTADIKAAIEYAAPMFNTEDGGTCNCDTPMVFLPRWRYVEVEKAIHAAGAYPVQNETWKAWGICVPNIAHANARSRHTDAMCEYLEKLGYKTLAYQSMD